MNEENLVSLESFKLLEETVSCQNEEIKELKLKVNQILKLLKTEPNEMKSRSTPLKSGSVFQPLPSKYDPDRSSSDVFKKPKRPSSAYMRRSTNNLNQSISNPVLRRSSSNNQLNGVERKRRPSTSRAATTYNEIDGSVKMHLKGRPVILYGPSDLKDYDISASSTLSERKLELEWVYGYRGKDSRYNIRVLSNGEIVYFTAAVVVLFNPEQQTQRHYKGHNDDVKSLAIHPNGTVAASGQVAGLELDGKEHKGNITPKKPRVPQVHIWNIETLQTLHILTGFVRSVSCLSFSYTDGGNRLAVVDESNEHVLSVWNWSKELKIAEHHASKDPVFAVEFNPKLPNILATCGKGHVAFWSLNDSKLNRRQGLFEKNVKPKFSLCLSFTETGALLTGDSNGNVQIWSCDSRKISKMIHNVHEGPVFGICSLQDGGFITTGKDGFVKKYGSHLRPITEKQITEHVCRAIAFSPSDGKVYIGTRRNNILVGSVEDVEAFTTIVDGHFEELWGLAVHPFQSSFLTGAHDKKLISRNTETHHIDWIKNFEFGIQSAGYSSDGSLIAVGLKNGSWLVICAETQDVVMEGKDGDEQFDVIKFSPDDSYLAIGSHDNAIYIYQMNEDKSKLNKLGKCVGHSSYITHVDWSKDSQLILSNSGDYEVLAWDAKTCKQIRSASAYRDVEWDTQSCTLGFNTIGVWPEGADGTDVNSAARSHNNQLLVTGDDFGKVHLYKYPVTQPQSVSHVFEGHSSHVTSVQFLFNDKNVISTGGLDCTTMQWKLI